MINKYLLYIDILGFGELVEQDPKAIDEIYSIVDSLNVHRHDAFTTIVFSDTILVYNKNDPSQRYEHSYYVMFACEFAQDLLHRFVAKDRFFRAILTYGAFDHYRLENTECFYGPALVSSYKKEKMIQSHGLFIDNNCNRYNDVFNTAQYDTSLRFVYLTQALDRFSYFAQDGLPIDASLIDDTDEAYVLMPEIRHLQDIYWLMHKHPDPRVRVKHLAAWHFYRSKYQVIVDELERNKFRPESISPKYDWSRDIDLLLRDYGCSIGLK
jgi:hypothetical protein